MSLLLLAVGTNTNVQLHTKTSPNVQLNVRKPSEASEEQHHSAERNQIAIILNTKFIKETFCLTKLFFLIEFLFSNGNMVDPTKITV